MVETKRPETAPLEYTQQTIPLKEIYIEDRARKEFKNIKSLSESIAANGVLSPICVLKMGDNFKLLAGERRVRASKEASLRKIPALIFTERPPDWRLKEIELHENIEREDLTVIERAELVQQIHEMWSEKHEAQSKPGEYMQKETAERLGKHKSSVSQFLKIAKLKDKVPGLSEAKTVRQARKRISDYRNKLEKQRKANYRKKTAEDKKGKKDQHREWLCDRYILGNFFTETRNPKQLFDFVELDPDFGIDFKGSGRNKRVYIEDYTEIPRDRYVETALHIANRCFNLMKSRAWGICWYSLDHWHAETRAAFEAAGFKVVARPAIWLHDRGTSAAPGYLMPNAYETFFYFRKGNVKFAKMGHNNVFHFASVTKDRIHAAEKPIELYEEIFNIFCRKGQRVLIPFAGSGNSILAADNLQLNAFGFDLAERFKVQYEAKVWNGTPGHYKSYV